MGKKVDMVIKAFPSMIRSVNSEKFTAEVIMSDETKDRYGEVIKADAYKKSIKNFMKHPILLSSHDSWSSLRNQIGVWEKVWIEDKQLLGRAKYFVGMGNPEADWAWKLVELGVAAYSVGFISKGYEDTPDDKLQKNPSLPWRTFTEVELLETSQVLLPANPSALQKASACEDMVMRGMATGISEAMSAEDILTYNIMDVDAKFLIDMDAVFKEEVIENKASDDVEQIEIMVPDSVKGKEAIEHADSKEKLAINSSAVGEQGGKVKASGEGEEGKQLEDDTKKGVQQTIERQEGIISDYVMTIKVLTERVTQIEVTLGEKIDKLCKLLVGEDLVVKEAEPIDMASLINTGDSVEDYTALVLGTEKDSSLLAEIKQALNDTTKVLETKKMVDG